MTQDTPIERVETLIDVAEKMGLKLNVDSGTHLPNGAVEYDAYIHVEPDEQAHSDK